MILNLNFSNFFFIFSHMMFIPMNHTKHQSLIEPRRLEHFGEESDQPPPLPVKKKHSKLSLSSAYFDLIQVENGHFS